MWRVAVILVLIGLLVVSTAGNVLLMRQTVSTQAEADRLRQRAVAAEATRGALLEQLEQLRSGTGPAGASADGTCATAAGPDRALIQRIQQQVAQLRGLQPKSDVTLRFLDQNRYETYFLQNFERDYLPNERESDQKLLTILGLMNQNETVVQILLDILQEQVIGIYNEDEKAMYIVADRPQFGPDERDTVAHEYTHALAGPVFRPGQDWRPSIPKTTIARWRYTRSSRVTRC